jgi:hypothetical protein
MPKTLILFADSDPSRADRIADGARSVRFSEVDVLPLDPMPDPRAYDAIVIDAMAPDVVRLLGAATALTDKVGATFGGDDAAHWSTLRALANLGCLLVPPASDEAALGRRVATVAEWVRHARSHHHH